MNLWALKCLCSSCDFTKVREGWVQIPVSPPLTCQVLEPTLRKVAHLRVLCENTTEGRFVSSATLRGMSSVSVPTAMLGRGDYIFSIRSFFKTAVLKAKRNQTHTVKSSEPVLVMCCLCWKQRRSPWLCTGPKWWGRGNRKWVSSIFPHGENTSDPLWVLSLFGMPCVLQSVFSAYIP